MTGISCKSSYHLLGHTTFASKSFQRPPATRRPLSRLICDCWAEIGKCWPNTIGDSSDITEAATLRTRIHTRFPHVLSDAFWADAASNVFPDWSYHSIQWDMLRGNYDSFFQLTSSKSLFTSTIACTAAMLVDKALIHLDSLLADHNVGVPKCTQNPWFLKQHCRQSRHPIAEFHVADSDLVCSPVYVTPSETSTEIQKSFQIIGGIYLIVCFSVDNIYTVPPILVLLSVCLRLPPST